MSLAAAHLPLALLDGGRKTPQERAPMSPPPTPRPYQPIRWLPVSRAQENAQQLWGRDAWVVVDVRRSTNLQLSSILVVVAPMADGRLRRGFAQAPLLAQVEGYGEPPERR